MARNRYPSAETSRFQRIYSCTNADNSVEDGQGKLIVSVCRLTLMHGHDSLNMGRDDCVCRLSPVHHHGVAVFTAVWLDTDYSSGAWRSFGTSEGTGS